MALAFLHRFTGFGPRPPQLPWLPDDIDARIARTNGEMAEAGREHVLLLGDSHAEYLGRVPPAGVALVNGAVGGTGTAACLHLLATYRYGAEAALAILSTGFNDLRNGPDCESPANLRGFGRSVAAALDRIAGRSRAVLVLAIPPVDPVYNPAMSRTAIATYSRVLEAEAARQPFATFVDPFPHLREGDYGTCRPGGLYDGLHVADNRAVWAGIASACRSRGLAFPPVA